MNPVSQCNADCHCDYVKYNPVCSEDGQTSFVSACHAGCKRKERINGTMVFYDCSCISTNTTTSHFSKGIPGANWAVIESHVKENATTATPATGGTAYSGNCIVDCMSKFYIFLAVVCLLKFSGATGRASNFLVTVRYVKKISSKNRLILTEMQKSMLYSTSFFVHPMWNCCQNVGKPLEKKYM